MQIKKLPWMALFAIGMAFFEAAVVVYLRRLYNINDLMLSKPWFDSQIGAIEVGREFFSLVMLLSVGWMAGRKLLSRLGFTLLAFGLWDIFYYLWLKVFIGWPDSVVDPDILFYIPLPWWGPVLAPALISTLLIAAGLIAVIREEEGNPLHVSPYDWMTLSAGIVCMLYTFMADALKALPASTQTLNLLRPTQFNWLAFIIGFILTGAVVWRMARSKPALHAQ
jgi:hypothetical protein